MNPGVLSLKPLRIVFYGSFFPFLLSTSKKSALFGMLKIPWGCHVKMARAWSSMAPVPATFFVFFFFHQGVLKRTSNPVSQTSLSCFPPLAFAHAKSVIWGAVWRCSGMPSQFSRPQLPGKALFARLVRSYPFDVNLQGTSALSEAPCFCFGFCGCTQPNKGQLPEKHSCFLPGSWGKLCLSLLSSTRSLNPARSTPPPQKKKRKRKRKDNHK